MGEESIEKMIVSDLGLDTVEVKEFGTQRKIVAKRTINPGEILIKSDPIYLVLRKDHLT